tara:strand:+ start:236 stop:1159 length:924 start_codon:yes stop_codon:yes gene_type:complete
MEFFNKKEEVIDFKLTEYGKNLLAQGKLKPVYYAFFDDDVLYDVSGSGVTETQNDARARIQSNTPKMKIIATRTSAEERVNRFISNLETAIGNSNSDPADNVAVFKQQQPFAEKGKLAAYPLGYSSLNSQYNPAWQFEILSKPEISSSARYLNDNDYIDNIPQIDITVDYQMFFKQGNLQVAPDVISDYFGETNIFLALRQNYLMFEIIEQNTDFEKENFDIEVSLSSSSASGSYQPKAFVASNPNEFVDPAKENVEYYINVLVDGEIPTNVLQELNISDRDLSGVLSGRLDLNHDLYSTEDAEPCD